MPRSVNAWTPSSRTPKTQMAPSVISWAAAIKVRPQRQSGETAPMGTDRREGVVRPEDRPHRHRAFRTRLAPGCGWCKLLIRLDKRESTPCLASTLPTTR